MNRLVILFYLLTALHSVRAQDPGQADNSLYWPEIKEETKPWTRWWWMGSAVNEEEMNRLLGEYAANGIGGVEITPIYGVKGEEDHYLDFLSPAWMKMLSATIRAADQFNMGVDMNTGTGWPFGGPHISSQFAAKQLQFYEIEAVSNDSINSFIQQICQPEKETLLALSGIDENGERINLMQQEEPQILPDTGTWHVYAATQLNTNQQVKRAAPGGEGLVFNHFSREATLHYLERFDEAMNHQNPGIRSYFNDSYELVNASSTIDLFELFRQWKGYDLALYLKELSGKGEEDLIGRIKSDYRDVLGRMILENFTSTWTGWAHAQGALTRNQAHGSPSNLLDLYSEVDIPELEIFNATRFPFLEDYLAMSQPLITDSNPLFKKFATSAAHLQGHTLVSSETFTWLNEHFRTPLYQCKPEIDNLFTAGVNHLFFHGTAYSPEEAAWPGWLFYASMHMEPGNPQWEDMKAMNEYIARCQSVLQLGEHTNDFLVYWSPDDYFHQPGGLERGLALHTSDQWIQMPEIASLYDTGYQFDLISDRIIGLSEVREDGLVYTYGKVPYKVLVLPHLTRIRLSTFKKLLQMAQEGATIVFSNLPDLVTGFKDFRNQEKELARLAASIEFKDFHGTGRASFGKGFIWTGDLQQVLSSLEITRETLADDHVKNISRRTEEGTYYFIANHEKKRLDRWLSFKHGAKNALFMNPMTGGITLAESTFDGQSASVQVVLEPGASMIIYFPNKETAAAEPDPYYREEQIWELSSPWSLTYVEGLPDTLPDTLLTHAALWSDLKESNFQRFVGTCAYETNFFLDPPLLENYLLRFEHVEASARIILNGQKVGTLWCFPFEVEVGPFLKDGVNELRVEVSNLGANGIRYLDLQGVNWKKFHNINLVNLEYKPFDASGWELIPSGLKGKVELVGLKSGNHP